MTGSTQGDELAPLIVHVLYKFDIGGLENGVVNLVNRMAASAFRHAIVCLTHHTDFRNRISRPEVQVYSLDKRPGNDFGIQLKLLRLFRALQPDLVHTRNLAALEAQAAAAFARVPVRIHSEHGRDVDDIDGRNPRRLLVRRTLRPLVHHYVAVSRDLERYLLNLVHVPRDRLSQIYNGVDTEVFRPSANGRVPLPDAPFGEERCFTVGWVGRMDAVKDPANLARGFAAVCRTAPDVTRRLRLVMVGDGPLRPRVEACLAQVDVSDATWLPGARGDIPEIMRGLDVFVLPSRSEGISNTVLEAMASGLPVIACRVGGNPELVEDGRTGTLVPPDDPEAIARAILAYLRDPGLRRRHAEAARRTAVERFSLGAMVEGYTGLYKDLLRARRPAQRDWTSSQAPGER